MSTAGHRIGRDTHWQVSETKHPTLRAQMQVSRTKGPFLCQGPSNMIICTFTNGYTWIFASKLT